MISPAPRSPPPPLFFSPWFTFSPVNGYHLARLIRPGQSPTHTHSLTQTHTHKRTRPKSFEVSEVFPSIFQCHNIVQNIGDLEKKRKKKIENQGWYLYAYDNDPFPVLRINTYIGKCVNQLKIQVKMYSHISSSLSLIIPHCGCKLPVQNLIDGQVGNGKPKYPRFSWWPSTALPGIRSMPTVLRYVMRVIKVEMVIWAQSFYVHEGLESSLTPEFNFCFVFFWIEEQVFIRCQTHLTTPYQLEKVLWLVLSVPAWQWRYVRDMIDRSTDGNSDPQKWSINPFTSLTKTFFLLLEWIPFTVHKPHGGSQDTTSTRRWTTCQGLTQNLFQYLWRPQEDRSFRRLS